MSALTEDVLRYGGFGRMHPYQLVLDQRIYCVPGNNLLATIPVTDDRILFHEIDFGVSQVARPDQ